MMLHVAYIGAALLALVLLASWMFVVSRRHVTVRAIGAAVSLVLAFAIWINVGLILGYAVPEQPSGKVMLLGMLDARSEGLIYLWVRETDGPRAYALPYSEALAGELLNAEARRRGAGGGAIILKFGPHADGHGGDGSQNGLGHDHSVPVTITVIPMLPAKN